MNWHSIYCKDYCLLQEYEFQLIDSYQLRQELAGDHSLAIASIIWHTKDSVHIKLYLLQQYHEWAHLFSREQSSKLLEYSTFDYGIKLVSGAEVPFGPLYPVSEQELKALKEWPDKQVETRKIVKSKSSAGAPILLVRKSNSTYHICVDYWALNKVMIKNRYPLPLITELKERLNKAKIFTKLDLKNSFNLIRMSEENEQKIAFPTRFGLYHWRVMPFGLCNAPATFQAMMDHIFHDLLDEGVVIYIDDILIYSNTEKEHEVLVKEVLARLDKAELALSLHKSYFHTPVIEFLSYIISAEGIKMTERKVQEVQNWPLS